ncbi:MAG: hypothetical protein JW927_06400 [Deltaproteobacteria bacterium]|nr:hypothetical protein [Deltaproteobacteria bacterium]
MGYNVTISENSKYIIGKLDEPLDREAIQQLTREYVEIIRSTGIKRILNDVRGVPDAMGITDGYEFAYTDTRALNLPGDIRAAILTDPGDTSHSFQATVAHNAGYMVKVFDEMGAAVAWLLEGLR